jgi:hypothetical protein
MGMETEFPHYYYPFEITEDGFTVTPTANLSFPRLLNQEPACWISPNQKTKLSPKNLILTDWTLAHKTNSEKKIVIEKLETLMRPPFHFKLYVSLDSSENTLIPIQSSELSCLMDKMYLKRIAPISNTALREICAAKGISADAFIALDPYEISLLSDSPPSQFRIKISDLSKTHHSIPAILNSFKEREALTFQDDIISVKQKSWLSRNKETLINKGSIIADYESIRLNLADFPTEQISPTANYHLNPDGMSDVTEIDLSAPPSPSQLEANDYRKVQQFFQYLKHLKKLRLNNFKASIPVFDFFPTDCLKGLNELQLESVEAETPYYSALLNKVKEINTLTLDAIKIENVSLSLSLDALSNLTTLVVTDTAPSKPIFSILNKAKKLKHFHVTMGRELNENIPLADDALCELETLNLFFVNVQRSVLETILNNAQHLKQLSLTCCMQINSNLSFTKKTFSELQSLALGGSNINAYTLSEILKRAKRLKSLSFSNWKGGAEGIDACFTHIPSVENVSFEQFKYLDLALHFLLQNGDKLKEIEIKNSEFDFATDASSRPILHELETIIFEKSTIHAEALSELLHRAPNLKTLRIDDQSVLVGVLELSPSALLKLENIFINRSLLTHEAIGALLHPSSNFKTISLEGEQGRHSSVSSKALPFNQIDMSALAKLEDLRIVKHRLSNGGLSNIINSAKKIKKFHLSLPYNNPIDNLTINRNALLRLESIFLRGIISTSSLISLLNQSLSLKKLTLKTPQLINDTFIPNKTALSKLKSLSLSESIFRGIGLSNLMNSLRNVQSIELTEIDFDYDTPVTFERSALSHLENFTCNTAIPYCFLEHILNQSRQLKAISITGSPEIPKPLALKKRSLSQLKKLQGYGLTDKSLTPILKHAINIECIELSNSYYCKTPCSWSEDTLSQLKEITLVDCDISGDFLSTILNHATHLYSLKLAVCLGLDEELHLSESAGNQLLSLDLSGSDISLANMLKLLSKATNLTVLQLDLSQLALLSTINVRLQLPHILHLIPEKYHKPKVNESTSTQHAPQLEESSSNSALCDTNTSGMAKTTFHLEKNIYPISKKAPSPEPRLYREHLYDHLVLLEKKEKISTPFLLNNQAPIKLTDRPIIEKNEDLYAFALSIDNTKSQPDYYAKQSVTLSQNWQPLISFSPYETMTHFRILSKDKVEVKYSERDNLYYIRALAPIKKKVDVEFLFNVSPPKITPTLPKEIKELVETLRDFSKGELAGLTASSTPKDTIEAIINQKKGSCRHRVTAFMYIMAERYPNIKVRAILSKCHRFVEININGTWITTDLGGYPSTLKTTEKLQPTPKHNIHCHMNMKVTPSNFKFEFKGAKKTHDQAMIIHKLSQYLSLTGGDETCIALIQDGICAPLSSLFNTFSLAQWQRWIKPIIKWDGKPSSISKELTHSFDTLIASIQYEQTHPTQQDTFFGTTLFPFLKKNPQSLLISNPWHRICVKYFKDNHTWLVYDPNNPYPPQEIADKDLQSVVQASLGNLLSIQGNYPNTITKELDDTADFIASGGLLLLSRSVGIPLLEKFDLNKDYPISTLQGLFLRDTKGRPAWLSGIEDHSCKFIFISLLNQLREKVPETFLEQIKKSISELSAAQKGLAFKALLSTLYITPKKTTLIRDKKTNISSQPAQTHIEEHTGNQSSQDEALYISLLEEQYLNFFSQPELKSTYPSFSHWLDTVLSHDNKKKLVIFENRSTLQDALITLFQRLTDKNTPYFFIDSPEDLICLSPWIKKRGFKGFIQGGPGGRLYDFIKGKYPSNTSPSIIVNYANFKPKDIVRFNSLLDDQAKADGIPVPPKFNIIGFSDKSHPNFYQEPDFLSRFNQTELFPFQSAYIENLPPPIKCLDDDGADTAYYEINFFHGQDWKERLLGTWSIDGAALIFKEGALLNALRSKRSILIANPPNPSDKFDLFFRELQIKGTYLGFTLPKIILTREGYPFKRYAKTHRFTQVSQLDFQNIHTHQILNPSTLPLFFHRYHCNDVKKTLSFLEGKLQAHKHRYRHKKNPPPLNIQVTRFLNRDEWGLILEEANKLDILLDIALLPGISLPPELLKHASISRKSPSKKKRFVFPFTKHLKTPHHAIIITNDIDAEACLYMKENKSFLLMDVSESKPHDLFDSIYPEFDKANLSFSFQKIKKDILVQLERGKKVILKGPFSDLLFDALLPYLKEYPTSLTLITDNEKQWEGIKHLSHQISTKDKKKLLSAINTSLPFSEEEIKTHSFSELRTISKHHYQHPEIENYLDAPWEGLQTVDTLPDLGVFDYKKSSSATLLFNQSRLKKIHTAFKVSPIICLSGITGVGKSSFIESVLSETNTVFFGEKKITQWARNKKGGILFIDEANITQRDWSEFEGLFNTPPSIFIDGEFFPLSPAHKVIFAFNPADYGGERKVNRLFKRHGNTVIFDPIPLDVIYELALKPLFNDTALASIAPILSAQILKVYESLFKLSPQDALISIRELKSIVMMTISAQRQFPDTDPMTLTNHFIKEIVSELVPPEERLSFKETFPAIYQTQLPASLPAHMPSSSSQFIHNKTTQILSHSIQSFLTLREYRLLHRTELSNNQLYGGLSGLIIEGEPGLGKSQLVLEELKNASLHEASLSNTLPDSNAYYCIPATLSLAEKKRLILKAFHEGNIVIMDEINASASMERFFNALLMGKTPEGQWAKNPGFLLFGTQNAISMSGRNARSLASARRILKKTFPLYSKQEMIDILSQLGLTHPHPEAIINAFLIKRAPDSIHETGNIPTFRDVIEIAHNILKEQKIHEQTKNVLIQSLTPIKQKAFQGLDTSLQSSFNALFKYQPRLTTYLLDACYSKQNNTYLTELLSEVSSLNQRLGVEPLKIWLRTAREDKSFNLKLIAHLNIEAIKAFGSFCLNEPSFFKQLSSYTPVSTSQRNKLDLFTDILNLYQKDGDISRATTLFDINHYIGTEHKKIHLQNPWRLQTAFHSFFSHKASDKKLAISLYDSIAYSKPYDSEDLPPSLIAVLSKNKLDDLASPPQYALC